jgi:alpha-tubulin suppressor-like RCC1 family protein
MGDNFDGQLGADASSSQTTPIRIVASGVASVSAGHHHTLLVKTDGSLWGMGYNGGGQLGLGDHVNRYSLSQIPFSSSNQQITPCGGRLSSTVIAGHAADFGPALRLLLLHQ